MKTVFLVCACILIASLTGCQTTGYSPGYDIAQQQINFASQAPQPGHAQCYSVAGYLNCDY